MNASQFIHISSWLIQNSRKPMDAESLSENLMGSFWPRAKIQHQRWQTTVNQSASMLQTTDPVNHVLLNFFSTCHEIILAESLTRIWLALAVQKSGCNDDRVVGLQVVEDHSRLRKQVLSRIQQVPRQIQHLADQCFALQQLNEQCNDLMLSQLPVHPGNQDFSINKLAFAEFARCASGYDAETIHQSNIALCLSFSQGISKLANPTKMNEDLNSQFVETILANFHSEEFNDLPFDLSSTAIA